MNNYRPRWSEEWRGTIEEVRQLGPERVRLMLEEMKEYNFSPKEPDYKEEYRIEPGSSRKRGILLPCVHAPFHNVRQFASNLELIEHIKPDFVGIMGDFLDAFSVSAHNRGQWSMPGLTLQQEYDETNVLLDLLHEALPHYAERFYLAGNHEDRIARFKKPIDSAKLGGAIVDYHQALRLKDRGFESLAPYSEARCFIGDVVVIHGNYWGVHAAAKHLKELNQSVIFCHTHRWQQFSTGDKTAYNIGWGGDPESKVFRYKKWWERERWVNACAIVDLHENGKTTVTPLRYDGQYFFEGKKF